MRSECSVRSICAIHNQPHKTNGSFVYGFAHRNDRLISLPLSGTTSELTGLLALARLVVWDDALGG